MSIITSLIADTTNAAQREKMACLLTRLFNGAISIRQGLYARLPAGYGRSHA